MTRRLPAPSRRSAARATPRRAPRARQAGAVARALLWTALVAALLVVLAIAALTWGPNLQRDRIAARAGEAIGRELRIARIEVSPFSGRIVLSGLSVAGAAGGPAAVEVESLRLKLDTGSLLRGPVVVEDVEIDAPRLRVARVAPDRFDFADVVERFGGPPSSDRRTEWRVDRIAIERGRIEFDDRVVGARRTADAIALEAARLTNRREDAATPATLKAAFTFEGRPARLAASATPFAERPAADGTLRLDALPLAAALPWVRLPADVRVAGGTIGVDAKAAWQAARGEAAQRLEVSGEATLDALRVLDAAGEERIAVDSIALALAPSRPLDGTVHVRALTLRAPRATAGRRADGTLEWPAATQAVAAAPLPASPASAAPASQSPSPEPPSSAASSSSASPSPASTSPSGASASSASAVSPAAVASPSGAAPGSPHVAGPRALRVDALTVADGRLRWRDAALAAPLDLAVAPLSLDARELSIPDLSRPAVATGRARVEAVVDGEARATAALALDGARARVEAVLSGVDAARYAPLAGPVLAARIEQGRLEARATLDWDGEARTWRIGDGGAELAGLRVTHPETKPAGVARIAVSGVSVDGAQRRVELGALAVEGATLDVRRDAQGRIDLQSWIGASDRAAPAASGAPAAPATPAAVATSATSAPPAPPAALAAPAIPATPSASPLVPDVAATEPAPPWTLLARSVSVTGLDLGYTDVRIARDRALPRIALTARASDVTLDPRRPTAFEANATLADGSRLGARGTLRPEPLALDAQVRLQRVVLTHADPYLSPYLNVSVASGQLWGAGRLVVDAAAGAAAPRVRFDGEASINEFRAIDEATSDDFLRWGALALPSVKVDWRADRPGDSLVDIGPVAFVDFYSRIILSPQGRLNLGSVVADPDRPAGATSVTAVPGTPGAGRAAARAGERTVADVPPRAGRAGPRPTIRIGTVRIASGNVDFTDLFIRPNYSANLTGLVGSIDPIASDRAEPADVLVTGRVDDDTPLEIVGKIDPLSERRLVDLRAIARGFDLPKLSPYSGRWAGYAIEKGKLTADVRYRIEGDRLTAENKLVINQLTFGDRVESADATSLPVRLAVSLLKDRNGNIDLDLPISGTISDPQFSVGSLIWKAIGNVVTRVVASPFSFLASLGSVPDVELGHVAFAAGGAELDDEDRGRLDALAKAMQARPELSLEIAGVADPSADREAMQRERLERTLKVAKLAEMRRADPAAELPALREVTLDAVERAGLLERAWRDAKLDAGAAGKVPAPAELERLLIERSTVAGEDVRQIAQQRAQAARDYLHEERGIASDRLYLLAPRVAAPGDALPPMRADFSVTAR